MNDSDVEEVPLIDTLPLHRQKRQPRRRRNAPSLDTPIYTKKPEEVPDDDEDMDNFKQTVTFSTNIEVPALEDARTPSPRNRTTPELSFNIDTTTIPRSAAAALRSIAMKARKRLRKSTFVDEVDPKDLFGGMAFRPTLDVKDASTDFVFFGLDSLPLKFAMYTQYAIRFHVIDKRTWSYLEKTNPDKNVLLSHIEHEPSHIIPVTTMIVESSIENLSKPLRFMEHIRCSESYSSFLNDNIIILFEVIGPDLPEARISGAPKVLKNKGWSIFAWGFFKPIGKLGEFQRANTEQPVKIQMYEPLKYGEFKHKRRRKLLSRESLSCPEENNCFAPDVLSCYVSTKRKPLDWTMTFNMQGITPKQKKEVRYPRIAIESHEVQVDSERIVTHASLSSDAVVQLSSIDRQIWDLLSERSMVARWCGIRDPVVTSVLPAARMGANIVSYSPCGRFLAVACLSSFSYKISIYNAFTNTIICSMPTTDMLHSIEWRCTRLNDEWDATATSQKSQPPPSSSHLLVTLASGTVQLLALDFVSEDPQLVTEFVIQCPSWVPSAVFIKPTTDEIDGDVYFATCSYDRHVRLYRFKWKDPKAVLCVKSLVVDEKFGSLQSIVFSSRHNELFVGTDNGNLIVFSTDNLSLEQTFEIKVSDGPITSMHMQQSEVHLLIVSRDGVIRAYQPTYRFIGQRFAGAPISRSPIRATYSPDGKYVLSGGEDGRLHMFDGENVLRVSANWSRLFHRAVLDVSYHPLMNMVAVCATGPEEPVLILESSKKGEKELEAIFVVDDAPVEILEKTVTAFFSKTQRLESKLFEYTQ
ncbi:hypothetical protein PCE1_004398 [Barthelona sp. PCE]